MTNNIQYINTPDQLVKLCEQIKKEPWLALDTEFFTGKNVLPKVLPAANSNTGMGGMH